MHANRMFIVIAYIYRLYLSIPMTTAVHQPRRPGMPSCPAYRSIRMGHYGKLATNIPWGTEPNRNSRLSREPCLAASMSSRPTLPTRQPLPGAEWTSGLGGGHWRAGIAVVFSSGWLILANVWLCVTSLLDLYPIVDNRSVYIPLFSYFIYHIYRDTRDHQYAWLTYPNRKLTLGPRTGGVAS